jgi:hypothetical protein
MASTAVSGFVNFLMASLIRWKKDLHALTIAESMINLHFGWLMLIMHHSQNGGKQHGLVECKSMDELCSQHRPPQENGMV